jgi:hypothetical protein
MDLNKPHRVWGLFSKNIYYSSSMLKKIIILLVSFPYFFLLFGQKPHANGIQLTPAYIELTMESGTSRDFTFQLKGDELFTVETEFLTGEIIENNQTGIAENNQLGSWISVIESGKKDEFKFTITVPKDTPSGFYIPMVQFSAKNDDSDTQIGINAKLIGSLYTKVINPKDKGISSKIEAQEFTVANKISFAQSNTFNVNYKNVGNVYTKAIGYFEIYDPQGYRLNSNYNINSEYKNIHPNQLKSETYEWKDDFSANNYLPTIGEYRVKLFIKSIDSEKFEEYASTFFVLPPIYIAYGVGTILVLILIVLFTKKYYKSANMVKVSTSK